LVREQQIDPKLHYPKGYRKSSRPKKALAYWSCIGRHCSTNVIVGYKDRDTHTFLQYCLEDLNHNDTIGMNHRNMHYTMTSTITKLSRAKCAAS